MKWFLVLVALTSLAASIGALEDQYDVIVVGSEPPAVAAAVAAARGDMNVLLVTDEPVLGGSLDLCQAQHAGYVQDPVQRPALFRRHRLLPGNSPTQFPAGARGQHR